MKDKVEAIIIYLLVFSVSLGSPCLSVAQTSGNPAPASPGGQTSAAASGDPNEPWPRVTTYQGATVSIYQPQIENWTGNQLSARAAVRIQSADKTDYGVIWLTARTEVDKVNRVVTLADVSITKQNFPTVPNNGYVYANALVRDLPWNKTVPLDLLEADLVVTNAAAQQKTYELQNDPPIIYYSMTPAVLALIDGQPALAPTADNMQKVINSRALIVYDPRKSMYYLALMDGWMEAPAVQGPWSPAEHAPTKDLNKIKQGAVQTNSNQPLGNPQESMKDAQEDGVLPSVYVSTQPAELVVTQGEPQLTAIPGIDLQYVSNTGADIFFDTANQSYYVLLAGRWFQSPTLQNAQWSFVPGGSFRSRTSRQPPRRRLQEPPTPISFRPMPTLAERSTRVPARITGMSSSS